MVKKEKRQYGGPNNILWKLFRISAEKVKIPKETEDKNLEVIHGVMKEK